MKQMMAACILTCNMASLYADEADVIRARADCDTRCAFHVTVQHADEGWKHYADKWDILDTNGKVLAIRILHHPHEHEQPFTRSLNNVAVPETMNRLVIRAHDSVHGYGGKTFELQLPRREQ